MKQIEISVVFLFVLTVVMSYSGMAGSREILLFATGCVMFYYLVSAIGITRSTFVFNVLPKLSHGQRSIKIVKSISGLVFSFSFLVLLANELLWDSRDFLTLIDAALLTSLMLASMILMERREPKTNRTILFRSLLITSGLIYYSLVPVKSRLEWKFDDQYYREILLFSIENPTDEDARFTVREYERRLNGSPFLENEDALQGVDDTHESPSE